MSSTTITASSGAATLVTTGKTVISHGFASRGVLALQGTGMSVVSGFGARFQAPKRVIESDTPERGWLPEFAVANSGAYEIGVDYMSADPSAASLRKAHLRSVIRSRHRSRLR